MQEGTFSRTARRVAMRRAAHQLFDDPKVLDDSLALRILAPETIVELQSKPEEQETRFSRALRAFLAARSRFAEDELASAVQRGVQQYVVLGAGLDTSAYRAPIAGSSLRVFEVDHPATQAWKRERLRASEIHVPSNLTFVPVDFERQSLAEELGLSGFQSMPTFFSWLGVTPYLTREAFDGTMRFIVTLPASTTVAFDYAVDPATLDAVQQAAVRALAARVEAAGEPFRLFFVPAELEREMQAFGFNHIENLDRDQIYSRYFKDRADGLQVTGELGRLMCAWK
jgi:methyltransferase (TIGR00027 family)